MNIVNIVIWALILISDILCFIAGLRLDNYYHRHAKLEVKDALEKQYVRLRANADADDPCRPYVSYTRQLCPQPPITQEFMDELQANGRAKTSFRKSDLTK